MTVVKSDMISSLWTKICMVVRWRDHKTNEKNITLQRETVTD